MFILKPIIKQIIWGGERLGNEFNIGTKGEKQAEAWQLTCREDGDNEIVSGENKGKLLSEFLKDNPGAIGKKNSLSRFPLLIKLIDAKDDLSIQIHPDDEYASIHTTDIGKTEMWYIVDCNEGAHLVYGLKEKYDRKTIEKAINEGNLESLVNYVPVHKGDVFFIPSNTVHAICKGILIAEIQQNSNITYRLYDYNRVGKDGKLRQLHIENGLDCIERFDENKITSKKYDDVISDNPFFKVIVKDVDSKYVLKTTKESFVHIMLLSGTLELKDKKETLSVKKGDSIFVPADDGEITMIGQGKIIISSL